jgi:hypothetical protein
MLVSLFSQPLPSAFLRKRKVDSHSLRVLSLKYKGKSFVGRILPVPDHVAAFVSAGIRINEEEVPI